MPRIRQIWLVLAMALLSASDVPSLRAWTTVQESSSMSFFVTSTGRGFGGNLGGLAGADDHCRRLADTVGQGSRTWRAYLSAPGASGHPPVHARDRIGRGPWVNARGVTIATDVTELHLDGSGPARETALTERGVTVGPQRHDILTGTNPDGTLSTEGADTTCQGWTSSDRGAAMLGHSNRYGGGRRPMSWNAAHLSRGCSQAALRASLGDALFYCFAAE